MVTPQDFMVVLERIPAPLVILNAPAPESAAPESDMRLLEGARAMNEDALTRIFDLYAHPLYNYALHLCHDPRLADEIVGDVFAKLLEQLSASSGPRTNLRSYLYAIAYHLVIDEVRYSNRRDSLDALDMHRYEGPAFQGLENRLLFEKVMWAIQNTLTKDQRHVIVLRFLAGMSLKETALIVEKQVNHVKALQNRAIQSLRKTLDTERETFWKQVLSCIGNSSYPGLVTHRHLIDRDTGSGADFKQT